MKVIITGATGMVGEGVLLTCLEDSRVSEVLVLTRRPTEVSHAKLKEILHEDFLDLSSIADQLTGYDACYFCLGVSSVGMDKALYEKLTYDLTMHVATTLYQANSNMVFCYVSGQGTDSSESGRLHWARVKGKTENDIAKLGFKDAFAFRPGFILPIKGQKRALKYYRYVGWMFPIGRKLAPASFCKLDELAKAMIHVSIHSYPKPILEGGDIIKAGNMQN